MSTGGLDTVSSPAFTDEDSARFRAAGWWSDATLSDAVRRNAENSPDRPAYVDHPGASLNWREFDYAASDLAGQLTRIGVVRGDRVAVWHGDSTAIHVLFVAIDDARDRELKWLISQIPEAARNRFRVTTMEKLPALFNA